VDPARVVMTTGSSGAFLLAFLAAFEPGDRVALATPCYPAYRNILLALGLEPVALPAGPESRFQPTVALLEAVEGPLDGLIVASPSNPAGTMLRADESSASSVMPGRAACASSPTKSTTGSPSASVRLPPLPSTTRPSSSTASRNITP
jgi:hypothetical protein